jgi:predicted RNase H-like HicB family nuclease
MLNYQIQLTPEPEGGFTVTVPALPGCITFGETLDEATVMAQEAIELYLESLTAHGDYAIQNTEYVSCPNPSPSP